MVCGPAGGNLHRTRHDMHRYDAVGLAGIICSGSRWFCVLYVIYCIGNIFALLGMVWFKVFGKEGIRKSLWLITLFVSTAYIGQVLGRSIIAILFGDNISTIITFATTDIMSLVFAILVIALFRKTDGMLEDQKAYLLRLDKQKKDTQDEPVHEEEF